MKKWNPAMVAGIAALSSAMWLTGCGAKPVEPPKAVVLATPDCVYPGTQAAAPEWICDAPVQGYPVASVGSYESTKAGPQFQKEQATASARVALAQRMKTQVTNMIKQYAETTGSSDRETVDKVNASVSKLITDQSLEGSVLVRSMTAPNGTMYVLVAMTSDQVRQTAESSVKTSMKNDEALWQKFQASKAQDELAAAIAGQK